MFKKTRKSFFSQKCSVRESLKRVRFFLGCHQNTPKWRNKKIYFFFRFFLRFFLFFFMYRILPIIEEKKIAKKKVLFFFCKKNRSNCRALGYKKGVKKSQKRGENPDFCRSSNKKKLKNTFLTCHKKHRVSYTVFWKTHFFFFYFFCFLCFFRKISLIPVLFFWKKNALFSFFLHFDTNPPCFCSKNM